MGEAQEGTFTCPFLPWTLKSIYLSPGTPTAPGRALLSEANNTPAALEDLTESDHIIQTPCEHSYSALQGQYFVLRLSLKCNLPKDGVAFKIMPLGLNKFLGNLVYKSGRGLTVKSEKETDGTVGQKAPVTETTIPWKGKKKGRKASLFIFTKFGEQQCPPAVSARSNQLQMGVARYLPTLEIKVQQARWPCFLSFPPFVFQHDNFICSLMQPVHSISILIHL